MAATVKMVRKTILKIPNSITILPKFFRNEEDICCPLFADSLTSKIFQTKQQIQLKHKVLFILIEGTKE